MRTDVQVIARLLMILRLCRRDRISFQGCLAEARRKHKKELRIDALTRPLP